MTEKKQDKLPVSQMIGFALNGCGSSCIAGIMGSFLTVYLTDNLLLSMAFITAIMTATWPCSAPSSASPPPPYSSR